MTDQQHIDAEMEREIQTLGLTAPRVTPDQIDALMRGVRYEVQVVPGTTTTLATAIAANGFKNAAAEQVGLAADQAQLAADQVALAQTQAANAANSAAAAEAAGGLGSIAILHAISLSL